MKLFKIGLCGIFLVAATTYFCAGASFLFKTTSLTTSGDFKLRWFEAKLFCNHINPYEAFDPSIISGDNRKPILDDLIKRCGLPSDASGYPPWAFPVFVILFTPFLTINSANIIFLFGSLLVFIAIYKLIYKYSRKWLNAIDSHLVSSACVSLNSYYIVLHNGQLSILLTFCSLYLMFGNSNSINCSLSAIILCLKPTFGAYPLLLSIVDKRKFVMLGIFFSVILWIYSSYWVRSSPFHFLGQMFLVSTKGGVSFTDIIPNFSLNEKAKAITLFLIGACASVFCSKSFKLSYPFQIAASLIFMRIFCYHRIYDNIMAVNALVLIGVNALVTKKIDNYFYWIILLVALIIPTSLIPILLQPIFYITVFCALLVCLLRVNQNLD
jgi:hypothetical protein